MRCLLPSHPEEMWTWNDEKQCHYPCNKPDARGMPACQGVIVMAWLCFDHACSSAIDASSSQFSLCDDANSKPRFRAPRPASCKTSLQHGRAFPQDLPLLAAGSLSKELQQQTRYNRNNVAQKSIFQPKIATLPLYLRFTVRTYNMAPRPHRCFTDS